VCVSVGHVREPRKNG